MVLSGLVIVVIGMTSGLAVWHGRNAALEEHRRGMNSLGVVLAEQTSRYVQVLDLVLRDVQTKVASFNVADPADFQRQLSTPAFHGYLAERLNNVPQADAVVLFDANGLVVNWSRLKPVARLSATDRDYYQHFKEHDDPGLFIGSLSKGRATGNLSLFFVRRINGAGGQFLGLALATVDVRYLGDLYRAAGEHLRQTVTLLRRDGTMLMRYPDTEAAVGVRLPQTSPWYRHVAGGGGSYVTSGVLNGTRSLVSVHPLPDYPLVIDILMEEVGCRCSMASRSPFYYGFCDRCGICPIEPDVGAGTAIPATGRAECQARGSCGQLERRAANPARLC